MFVFYSYIIFVLEQRLETQKIGCRSVLIGSGMRNYYAFHIFMMFKSKGKFKLCHLEMKTITFANMNIVVMNTYQHHCVA